MAHQVHDGPHEGAVVQLLAAAAAVDQAELGAGTEHDAREGESLSRMKGTREKIVENFSLVTISRRILSLFFFEILGFPKQSDQYQKAL